VAKVKVEVTNAVVNGKGHGETLSIEQKDAERLESIGYVKILSSSNKKSEGGE